jgi:exonuclease V gamma subunit
VVPSPAMGRWVNLQLARVHGVAANVTYPLPASFVWQLAHGLLDDLPERDPLDPEAMAWKVFDQSQHVGTRYQRLPLGLWWGRLQLTSCWVDG